jgi:hypothetical protein
MSANGGRDGSRIAHCDEETPVNSDRRSRGSCALWRSPNSKVPEPLPPSVPAHMRTLPRWLPGWVPQADRANVAISVTCRDSAETLKSVSKKKAGIPASSTRSRNPVAGRQKPAIKLPEDGRFSSGSAPGGVYPHFSPGRAANQPLPFAGYASRIRPIFFPKWWLTIQPRADSLCCPSPCGHSAPCNPHTFFELIRQSCG